MNTRLLVLAANAWILAGVLFARSTEATGTCNSAQALRLTANAPLLSSGALTQLNMASLLSSSSGGSSNLVTVTVTNPSKDPQSFRMLFELKAIPADPRLRESCLDPIPEAGGQGCWIQRKMLTTTTLGPGETWVRTSSMLESESYQGKSIDPDHSEFQKLLVREGFIPPGAIYLNVGLMQPLQAGLGQENIRILPTSQLPVDTCAWTPLHQFVANYQPTQSPTLLSPGSSTSDGYEQTASATPTFVFAGNLDGFDLGGESPYRLSIWEIHENETLSEALERRALRSAKVARSPVTWDPGWPALEPGKRYLWRVDAILRGTAVDWLPSTPFGFRIPNPSTGAGTGSSSGDGRSQATLGVSLPPGSGTPQATPEQLEILQALSLIIGPYRPVLEQLVRTSLPDPYGLRLGMRPATRTDFQDLVRDILEGRATVTGAEATP